MIGKPGKTIDLLKAKSKPITMEKKRKKVPLIGTFEDYQSSKKKPVPPSNMAQLPPGQKIPGNEKLELQRDAKGMLVMAPVPNAKDAKMNHK